MVASRPARIVVQALVASTSSRMSAHARMATAGQATAAPPGRMHTSNPEPWVDMVDAASLVATALLCADPQHCAPSAHAIRQCGGGPRTQHCRHQAPRDTSPMLTLTRRAATACFSLISSYTVHVRLHTRGARGSAGAQSRHLVKSVAPTVLNPVAPRGVAGDNVSRRFHSFRSSLMS